MKEKELWQYFFNKPKKNYNKYMFEMPNYPNHLIYDSEIILSTKGNWSKNLFKNTNDLYLEIGSGSANFTSTLANLNPNNNYLGVEIRFKRLIQAAKKAEKLSLKNLVFLKKMVNRLTEFIGENELSGLYINFPDPWEGEEHKRLINKELFERMDIILKKGGKLYFKTDHQQYYEDVLELLKEIDGYEVVYHTDDLHNTEKAAENIKTEFEQLFLSKHNMNIKYVEIEKK